ncbi:MAG: hypothetical protein ACM3SM_14295 [Bacteroidota bacterium]
MISSISSSNSYLYQSSADTSNRLTDEQKKKLQEIIAQYDPETVTQEDMKNMMEEIDSAGIKPSKEFGEIMNEAGFKRPEKPEGAEGAGPLSETQDDLAQKLLELLKEKESGSINQEDLDDFIDNLRNSMESSQGNIVNQKV